MNLLGESIHTISSHLVTADQKKWKHTAKHLAANTAKWSSYKDPFTQKKGFSAALTACTSNQQKLRWTGFH